MPVNRNPYYGQDIGSAIGGLAAAFAPPSGSDAYGYTKAASERQQMGIQQQLAAIASDPTLTTQQKQDALGIAANFFSPTQSNRAVDVDASTKLATNKADNAQKMAAERYGALSEGQVLPAMPKSVADMYKLPESGPVGGMVKLSSGETGFSPDGSVRRGQVTAKPGEVIMPPTMGGQAPTSAAAAPAADAADPLLDAILRSKKPGGAPVTLPPTTEGATSPYAPAINGSPAPQPNNATAVPEQPYGVNSPVKGGPAVGRKGQSEYDKISDRKFAELDSKIFETAQTSFANKGTLERMSQILANPNLDTGALANTGLEARKILGTLGVDTGNMSDAETLRALGRQFALKLRDPSQGAGMPGALSDSDRMYLSSMAPGLENTIEGNKKLVDYYSRVNQRNIDIENLRQDYVARVGRTDEGFRTEVVKFANSHPLFPEAKAAAPTAVPTTGQRPSAKVPEAAVKDLRANPNTAAQFDEVFGKGAAAMYLGGAQ